MAETVGGGAVVERQRHYRVQLRLWLNKGDPVALVSWAADPKSQLADDGNTLITRVRVNRGDLMDGMFYGVEGMRVGGTRTIRIPPELAYGERGIPGVIPANAVLLAEITVLDEID